MWQKTYTKIVNFLGSRTFFWLILAFFVVQALWIAFSFRYPMAFDEYFHIPVIQIFSHQWSPFIFHQPAQYDTFMDLGHQGLFYHYLMSFPYRIFSLVAHNFSSQIVFLRCINILLAASGLLVLRRVFDLAKINPVHVNVGMLIFVLLPIVPLVAATVNYDNMLLVLTAWYLLISVKILRSRQVEWTTISTLVSVGCLASLVKYPFLPLFAASVVFLVIVLGRRHGLTVLKLLWKSFLQTGRQWQVVSAGTLCLALVMFSMVYVQNVVRYGTPQPTCGVTLSTQRCLASGVYARNVNMQKTRDQRPILSKSEYTTLWSQHMIYGLAITANSTFPTNMFAFRSSPTIMTDLLFFGTLLGLGTLLYGWQRIPKSGSHYYLIFMVGVLFLSIFIVNTLDYYKYHAALANQPRYLLSMLPILLVYIVVAVSYAFRMRWVKLTSLAILLLLFTQGGGVTTHILGSQDNWYWQNRVVIKANHAAKKILHPLVKE